MQFKNHPVAEQPYNGTVCGQGGRLLYSSSRYKKLLRGFAAVKWMVQLLSIIGKVVRFAVKTAV
jgi:hypothetical protein